jgi:hypothetical protein
MHLFFGLGQSPAIASRLWGSLHLKHSDHITSRSSQIINSSGDALFCCSPICCSAFVDASCVVCPSQMSRLPQAVAAAGVPRMSFFEAGGTPKFRVRSARNTSPQICYEFDGPISAPRCKACLSEACLGEWGKHAYASGGKHAFAAKHALLVAPERSCGEACLKGGRR